MAKCAICQKEPVYGNKLSITRSHISKRSTRTWKPNLRSFFGKWDGSFFQSWKREPSPFPEKRTVPFSTIFHYSFIPNINLTSPLKAFGTFFTTIVIYVPPFLIFL